MKVSKAKLAIPAVAIAVLGFSLAGCGSTGSSSSVNEDRTFVENMIMEQWNRKVDNEEVQGFPVYKVECVSRPNDEYKCIGSEKKNGFTYPDAVTFSASCDENSCIWQEEYNQF